MYSNSCLLKYQFFQYIESRIYILILSNSLFEKLSTHLSTLKAQNHYFAKHAKPQTEKPCAYKKRNCILTDSPTDRWTDGHTLL